MAVIALGQPVNVNFAEIKEVILMDDAKKRLSDACNAAIETFSEDPDMYEIAKNSIYIAGGAVRDLVLGKQPKDYDTFFYNPIDRDMLIKWLKEHPKYIHRVTINGNIECWRTYERVNYLIQFIAVRSDTPENLTNTFDFSINTGYYEPTKDKLYIPESLKTKELKVMDDVLFPVNALLRLPRFLKQGYHISHGELVKLATLIQARPSLLEEENIKAETMGLSFAPRLKKDRKKEPQKLVFLEEPFYKKENEDDLLGF